MNEAKSVGPLPHLLITSSRAKVAAAIPLSWDPHDVGCEAGQFASGCFTA